MNIFSFIKKSRPEPVEEKEFETLSWSMWCHEFGLMDRAYESLSPKGNLTREEFFILLKARTK